MMRRQVKKHLKGFTLIEIIIVIVILAVLSAIAVPKLSGLTEKARIKADQASIATLNNATMLYRVSNNISSDDVFANIKSYNDEERIQVLADHYLLAKNITAQQKDARFAWDIDAQKWGSRHKLDMTHLEASAKGFMFLKETGTITRYEGSEMDIEIPYKIAGVLVTEISGSAFKDKGLTSVTIPDSLKDLKQGTFYNNKLKTVKIPDGVKTLEYNVFANNELTSVELPDSLGTIGDYAFKNNQLKAITLPSSVKVIGHHAFENNQLEEIIIPNTVRDIHEEVFIRNKITSINIQGKPEKMLNGVFNQNGPNSDKDIVIEAADCPVIYKMNSSGEWIKQ